jgi:hypothetical protein
MDKFINKNKNQQNMIRHPLSIFSESFQNHTQLTIKQSYADTICPSVLLSVKKIITINYPNYAAFKERDFVIETNCIQFANKSLLMLYQIKDSL